jgi:hypothetical protein
MSHPSTTAAPAAGFRVSAGAGQARVAIAALALTLGAVATAAAVLWRPWGERNDFAYASLAPVRDAAWAGSVLDGLGIAAAGIALGIAVCLLAPARGAVWATTGAVLTGLGGVAFSAALVAFGVLAWYVTATDAIDAEAGTALLAYFEENPARIAVLQVPGFLLFTIGTLVLMVALWRARSVPRWLPIGVALLTVAAFIVPGRALDVVQALQMLSLVGVAWYLWRTPRPLPS